jgi:lysophospholipase L1-like esterase
MHWVGVWSASPSDASSEFSHSLAGQTIRTELTPLGAGERVRRKKTEKKLRGAKVRVHLSNGLSTEPLRVDAASISRSGSGAKLVSIRELRFNGHASTTIPAGNEVISDPVRLKFRVMQRLAVSTYVDPASLGVVTEHYFGWQTSYIAAGDQALNPSASTFTQTTSCRYLVTGVDVSGPREKGAVVAFGDSITDGVEGIDQNVGYPDFLARRIWKRKDTRERFTVLNAGISGNRILEDGLSRARGPSGISRLGRDVIALAGARTAIVLEGINDIGDTPASSAAVIDGLTELVSSLKAAGLRVLLGTLTPAGGAIVPTYGGEAANTIRIEVNDWIRSQTISDGVVDFDAGIRDPADPSRLLPRYDSSDHLHPNAAGYQAMARAVPLEKLSPKRR